MSGLCPSTVISYTWGPPSGSIPTWEDNPGDPLNSTTIISETRPVLYKILRVSALKRPLVPLPVGYRGRHVLTVGVDDVRRESGACEGCRQGPIPGSYGPRIHQDMGLLNPVELFDETELVMGRRTPRKKLEITSDPRKMGLKEGKESGSHPLSGYHVRLSRGSGRMEEGVKEIGVEPKTKSLS